ncbi:hypothetical protein ACFX2I_014059 [Malus domestica]
MSCAPPPLFLGYTFAEQRDEFVKLGGSAQVDVQAVVLDLPAKLYISWSVKGTGHEGNLQGGRAVAVVNRMMQKKELSKLGGGSWLEAKLSD